MSDKPSRSTLRLPRKQAAARRNDAQTPDATGKTGARARRARRQQHEQQKQQRQQQAHKTPQPRRPRPVNPRKDTTFTLFVSCPRALEPVLTQQLQKLGIRDANPGRAGCHAQANWQQVLHVNLHASIATRVLVQLAHGRVHREDDILQLAHAVAWEQWFGPEHTLRVDTSAIRSPMRSLQYCNLRAKDGICDRLREKEGRRPNIDTVRPDARVHQFLDETHCTLYLDTTGEPLFKRGWRFDKGEAPLRENLAAGMLAIAQWAPHQPLLDPFCGSGTILIEAAHHALNIPVGINRPFGFERLRGHARSQWQQLKQAAKGDIKETLPAPLVGVDIDPTLLAAARQNLERANLPADLITLQEDDACAYIPTVPHPGLIVTNPPYGERLEPDDTLWQRWASHLKSHYADWQVHVISNNLKLPQAMRLRPFQRYPLYNGPLDCRLFGFDMIAKT